ncbi:MAG: hypothetical protein M5U28_20775 [Sandaracinaceae bacterium]|nr:hypothetical protein [Sandaracinaceae bacterium]
MPASPSADALLDAFLGHASEMGLELYPAQEEAILELFADKSVVLDTPTGSGKSLVATALCFRPSPRGGAPTTRRPSRRWSARSSSRPAATSAPPTSG